MTRPTVIFNLDDSQTTYVVDVNTRAVQLSIPYTLGDDIGGTVPQVAPSYGLIHRLDDGLTYYLETLDGDLTPLITPAAGEFLRLVYADDANAIFYSDTGTFKNVSPVTSAELWEVPWPSGEYSESAGFKVGDSVLLKSNVTQGAVIRLVLATGAGSVIATTPAIQTFVGNGTIVVGIADWNTPGTPNVVVIDNTFTPTYREVTSLNGTQGFSNTYDQGYGDYTVFTNDYITFVTYDIVDNIVQTLNTTPNIPAAAASFGWNRVDATLAGNKLVVFGGSHNTATTPAHIKTLFVYDMSTNTFDGSTALSMPLDGPQVDYDYDIDRIVSRELPTWTVTGNITSGGSPAATDVHLLGYNMKRMHTVTSNGTTGDYTFRVYRDTPVTIVAEHPTSGNALIASNVVPVAE